MRRRRLSLVLLSALVIALPIRSAHAGQPASHQSKIDRALADALASGGATQRIIISVAPGSRDGIRQALRAHGDRILSEHPSVDAIAAEVHSADVAELAKHDSVAYVSIDATVYAGGVGPHHGPQGGDRIPEISRGQSRFAPRAQTLRQTLGLPSRPDRATPTGAGVTVAVIDSGIDPTDDFARRIVAFYDFTRGGIATAPYDDFGHGSHVAGLIGASGVGSGGAFTGIAPDVRFVGLKVLDQNGQGTTSTVIKALEFVTANKSRLGVQIVNLSLGHPVFAPAGRDPLVAAVEKAIDAGLIVVCSAGNEGVNPDTGAPGYTGITSPGNSPRAMTAGASDTRNTITRGDDRVAPYSSRGPTWFDAFAKPDFVAPGTRLVSEGRPGQTLFDELPGNDVVAPNGRPFLQLSGTSMSAAVVSGVVALMVDAHGHAGYLHGGALTANLAKAILEYSAISIAGADVLTEGAGEINAAGAVSLAGAIDTGAAPNSWWLRTGVSERTTIGGVAYPWSRVIVWGSDVLTGSLLFYDLPVWAAASWGEDNIVWGTFASSVEDNIVWGTTAVWAANLVWTDRVLGQRVGDNIVWGTFDGLDNIVWGTLQLDNIVWGTMVGDRIVFGMAILDNIVWGTFDGDNIVWGTAVDLDNIVWGTAVDDNIVWGTSIVNRLGGIF
jgi:serine protease AprX